MESERWKRRAGGGEAIVLLPDTPMRGEELG